MAPIGLTLAGLGAAVLLGLSIAQHHVLEHGLDVLLVALVIAAVYYARTGPAETEVPS